uniref:Uncharacterized protein n=1 Tax=Oryza barthii TaxID=65489 RepID=A0A0D3HSW2_9ORYZ
MVVATGRSDWHVRNIAQALLYKARIKQKQKGSDRILMPSVEGQQAGKWIELETSLVKTRRRDHSQKPMKSI